MDLSARSSFSNRLAPLRRAAGHYAEIAALAIVPTYAVVYAAGLYASSDGVSLVELGLMQVASGLAFFLAVVVAHAVLLPRRLGRSASRVRWALALVSLPVVEFAVGLAFAYTLGLVVAGFEMEFAQAMTRLTSAGQEVDAGLVASYGRLPFFVQAAAVNAAGIVLGTLVSWPIALKLAAQVEADSGTSRLEASPA